MTVIAGSVAIRSDDAGASLTRALLQEQRLYSIQSTEPRLATLKTATFGLCPGRYSESATVVANPRYMLVADVRLDNRDELLRRIGGPAHQADAELLLGAWTKAGEDCLAWILGDFALAVFDASSRELTLARDPSGQAPLHYAVSGGDVAFASMPTALGRFVGDLAIDRAAISATICYLRDDDPRSNFERIARVLPGELIRFRSGAPRRQIYWHPPIFPDEPLENSNLVEEYRHLLDVAVTACLKDSRRPVATHLSSGYDSSSVTATAARLLPSPNQIIAFTSAPAEEAPVPAHHWRIGDESGVAANTAAKLGIRHVVVRDVPPMRTVMRRQFLLNQDLNISVPNMAWLLQIRREAAAAGADCLLSGDCGNASLNAGGLYILAEWVARGQLLTWARQARLAATRRDTHWRGVLFNSFNRWMPTSMSDKLRSLRFGAALVHNQVFLRPEWAAKAHDTAVPVPHHRNGYAARAHLIRNGNPAMSRRGALAGEGVDERDPLADRRVIEFSLRVPPEQLYWNGVTRPLARAALADRLPKEVIDLPTRGLQSADWALRFTQTDAYELLEEVSESATAREILDLDAMKSAIADWPRQDWNEWNVQGLYRGSLIGALAAGTFSLVHEQAATDHISSSSGV